MSEAPKQPSRRPRSTLPKESNHADLWVIGILFPVLIVAAWFGWQVYERTLSQTQLPPKEQRTFIDNLAVNLMGPFMHAAMTPHE